MKTRLHSPNLVRILFIIALAIPLAMGGLSRPGSRPSTPRSPSRASTAGAVSMARTLTRSCPTR